MQLHDILWLRPITFAHSNADPIRISMQFAPKIRGHLHLIGYTAKS